MSYAAYNWLQTNQRPCCSSYEPQVVADYREGYRWGFNGMEKDDEVHGSVGTSYDFGARLYDPRVGRWLSLDPAARDYPTLSPYVFVANSPIAFVDPDGKKIRPTNSRAKQTLETAFNKTFERFPELRSRIVFTNIGRSTGGQAVNAFVFAEDMKDGEGNTMSLASARRIIKQSDMSAKERLVALSYLNAVGQMDVSEFQQDYDRSTHSSYGVLSNNADLAKKAQEATEALDRGDLQSNQDAVRSAAYSQTGEAEFQYYPNQPGGPSPEVTLGGNNPPQRARIFGVYNYKDAPNDAAGSQEAIDRVMLHITGGSEFIDRGAGVKHSMDKDGNYSQSPVKKN
ncbi:MAG: RHS repeat-associated core domain-containing protein [Flavobacteriales bacterium]